MIARVLVTDGDQRAALAITRSLGLAGYEVGVVSSRVPCLAGASKHAAWRESAPSAADDPAGFAAAVKRLVFERKIELIFPVTEAALLTLLPIRAELAPAALPFPTLTSFAGVSDKGAVLTAARGLGIAVPASTRLERPGVPDRAVLDALTFPLVVKPERSVRSQASGMAKLTVAHAADAGELATILTALPVEAFPLQLQQRIVGPGTGLFFLMWDGRVVARFAHRRLREKPPAGGVSVYSESIPVDEPLAALAERLLRTFTWQGVAMVEFKRDATTGVPYLMEINGRFWGSLQLAIDAGVDFPRLLADLALGRPVAPSESRAGVRCRWWWGDIDQLVTRLKRSSAELHLPPGTPGVAAMAARVLLPWLSPGRNEVLRLTDPGPGWFETLEWFRTLR